MKVTWLAVVVLACLLLAADANEKKRKVKKPKKETKVEPKVEPQENTDLRDIKEAIDVLIDDESIPADPCARKHCGAGKECRVNENGAAECTCISFCPPESDSRRLVCSNQNETWNSDCELYRMRCLCKKGSSDCTDPKYDHVHVDYFGECQKLKECTAEELVDFPRRMRDWLFNVMRDMADRNDLSPYYLKLEREAEKDLSHKWANAAIWKFCDLDGNPPDRRVSRHELFPIRAPLLTLEHCIGPFLDSCDVDNDHFITLQEWGKCLDLDEADIEDKCEEVRG